MADSKLRLSIITALDNAGLKATEQQLVKLEKQLSSVNSKGKESFYGLDNSMTGLPGKLGKVVGSIGKVGKALGTVGLAIEAFKQGWEIGTWLNDNVITPMFKIKDPIAELKKENKELAESHKKTLEGLEARYAREEKLHEKTLANIDAEIEKIKSEKVAYIEAAKAKNNFYNVGLDAETQQLNRLEFEDTMMLEDSGASEEQIAQLQAIYGIYKKQLEVKKELANFDAETQQRVESMKMDSEEIEKKWQKASEAAFKVEELKRQQDTIDNTWRTSKEWHERTNKLNEKIAKAKERADRLEREALAADNKHEAQNSLYYQTRQGERAVLAEKLQMSLDRVGRDYDMMMQTNGDRLGIYFNEEFAKEFNDNANRTYNQLELFKNDLSNLSKLDAIERNTAVFGELMTMK